MKKRTRRKLRIEAALKETQTPAFLLDGSRRIAYFNAGCEALTGWKGEEVVGVVCEYDSTPAAGTADLLASSLCPPPEVYAGEPLSVAADLACRDGTSRARSLNFYPLVDADGEVTSVFGVATDIEKPLPPARASLARRLHAELAALRGAVRQRYGAASFLGRGAAMQRVKRQIDLATGSREPVLFRGEPGTGKEHAARLIHNAGDRRAGAFVPIDCRELPAREVKSILRRMFDPDPSLATQPGLRPSTLYLHDVDTIARDIQQMLVEQFAGDQPAENRELRLMASTTTDLGERLAAEELRDDFYYLMTPLEILLPPLRERVDEIELLAQSFLESGNRGAERQIGGFTTAVGDQLRRYRWPGNVDELRAVVAEARAACTSNLVDLPDLPFRFRTGLDAQAVGPPATPSVVPLDDHLAAVEIEHIQAALEQVGHNKTRAAKLLGLTRARLYRRMESLGIEDREAGPG